MENNTKEKSVNTAYLLNLFLPGIGNIYYGQTLIGVTAFIMFVVAILLFLAAGSTTVIGIGVIILSIILAIPTVGIALLIGIPVGVIILFFGASSVFIWLFTIIISIVLVAKKSSDKSNN